MIKQGPLYFCCACNRCFYRSNVKILKPKNYDQEFLSAVNTKVKSFDGKVYICKTYQLQVSKSQMLCQGVGNNLYLDETPEAIKTLNKLEAFLLCKMLLFKKVVIMAKGQSPKVIGAVANVPVDVNETFDKLPNCDHVVLMKLKKKLIYKGHVFFESVNPEKFRRALALLKHRNHFYSDIKIEIDSIPSSFCYFIKNNGIVDNIHEDKKVIDFSIEVEDSDHNENENRNPLHEHSYTENETLIMNKDIVPGESHIVSSILDKKCEYLSFPDLFSK